MGGVTTMNHSTLEQARAAKGHVREVIGPKADLAGVGITRIDGGYGVKVNLTTPPRTDLPSEVDGVPLRVEVVGTIRKRGL
jgi:hypothetical protein